MTHGFAIIIKIENFKEKYGNFPNFSGAVFLPEHNNTVI